MKPLTAEASVRIEGVRSYVLRYPDPNDFSHERMTVLARVEADGAVGWGEGIAMWPEACRATALIIEEGFAPILREAGEIEVAAAWSKMRAHAWWYGEGGIANFALSALDMALWDIEAKLQERPLHSLLGGAVQSRLRACASCHVNKATLAECVAEVESYFARGFTSVKLGLGKRGLSPIGQDPDQVILFVRLLREALGPQAEILVDIGNGIRWDLDTGIGVARRLLDLGVGWIEEPFYPTDLDSYRALRDAVPIAIASGEREWTVTDYQRLIQSGTVDVLGVDPARAEGVTGFMQIDQIVGQSGLAINAHAWSTAITSAASLHLSAASTNARLFELKPHPVVVQTDLVDSPIELDAGFVSVPNRPGLGLCVNESVVERLTI